MRLRPTQHVRRSGFTLVELIVAAGLTVLIMAVLATGFQVGLQSLSTLKSAGELADRIRTAETLLRQDLDAPHFDIGSAPGVLRVSDLRFDGSGPVPPIVGGFFQIRQPAASTFEGLDQDGLTSTRTTANHGLSFTARRLGRTPGELFAAIETTNAAGMTSVINANPSDAAATTNTYTTDWAEVHWFLDTSRPTVLNGVQTFPLCRRVRLLTRNVVAGVNGTLAEVVSADASGNSNTLGAIRTQANRLGAGGLPPSLFASTARPGDDIVITNVVSFEVKPTWESGNTGTPLPLANVGVTAARWNADFPFDDFPASAAATQFDSALGGFAPNAGTPVTPARVTGVQVKIRVYDAKNKMTRQSVVTSKL